MIVIFKGHVSVLCFDFEASCIVCFFSNVFDAILGNKDASWDNEVSLKHPSVYFLWAFLSFSISHQGLIEHMRVVSYLPPRAGLSPVFSLPEGRTTWVSIWFLALHWCVVGKNIIWLWTGRCSRKGETDEFLRGCLGLEMQDPSLWESKEILWPLPPLVWVGFGGEEESSVRSPNVLSPRDMSGYRIALQVRRAFTDFCGLPGLQTSTHKMVSMGKYIWVPGNWHTLKLLEQSLLLSRRLLECHIHN